MAVKLYLGVEGVLLHRTLRGSGNRRGFAIPRYALEFLAWAVEGFECYWLTSLDQRGGNHRIRRAFRVFMFPNMPSYGVPGCTGWPALGPDHRGFRVRTGGRPPEDPDLSDRWIPKEYHDRPREILERHFPDLVGAPINETRACHYESSVDSNFIIDNHPDFDNVWLIGGGSSEGFKFGPVLGEYIAKRVLSVEDDPELAAGFRLKEREFEDEEEEEA